MVEKTILNRNRYEIGKCSKSEVIFLYLRTLFLITILISHPFSIDLAFLASRDTSSNFCCTMVGLKYVLINFCLKMGLSTVATMNWFVSKRKSALQTWWYEEPTQFSNIKSTKSTVAFSLSSYRKIVSKCLKLRFQIFFQ